MDKIVKKITFNVCFRNIVVVVGEGMDYGEKMNHQRVYYKTRHNWTRNDEGSFQGAGWKRVGLREI